MKRLFYLTIFITGFTLFYSCIDEYIPKEVEEMSNLLVVDGTITNGTTVIKLSKSVGIADDIANIRAVSNALVFIENDKGDKFSTENITPDGEYFIPTGALNPDTKYSLRIFFDGNAYESSFLSPLQTPEIDSVHVYKEAKGMPVTFTISTHGSENERGYYLWSFEEIWEVGSWIKALITFTGEVHPDYKKDVIDRVQEYGGYFVFYDYETNWPYYNAGYRCWKYDQSRSLLLGSSDNLAENRIVNQKIHEAEPTDDRFSSMYYIKLKQQALRKESFDYLSNLQKNNESMGDVFGPIPSEMKGNIICTSDPDINVIGYVEVSTTSLYEKYIPYSIDIYEFYKDPSWNCNEVSTWNIGYSPSTVKADPPVEGKPPTYTVLFAPTSCVDCRVGQSNLIEKPNFWPD